ncbi:DENN domain-containing protein 1B-like isoform X2 [Centruroides vittatus]|uniref:DENN domain-containing protein 1B-like isoform X2 n=1 Tax=Centruroides vittatus TaxID=120091 RepID=UPI00350F153E
MGSRIRDNPTHVFECFCEITIPSSCNESAWITKKFPESYKDEEILKSVPEFAYPCEFNNNAVQHFSFVLTSIDSKWTFGFCRHAANSPTCFVILSYLPWHETFYKLLNHAAEIAFGQDPEELWKFLEVLYKTKVPGPGLQLHVTHKNGKLEFISNCPDHHKLPSIPENRNLTEYYNAVEVQNMMIIFASMLHERRILITSKKLSRLSACVQAANALIYPMHWQHIFIPVLPNHLLDYLSAPMPFLIGVPLSTLMRVKRIELGEIVLFDVDTNKIETPFHDLDSLPSEVVTPLKRTLKNPNTILGDGIPRAFLRALVQLIGGYWSALRLRQGEKISFNPTAFVQSRPAPIQPFLQKMLELQIFQQFIESRLHMLNTGKGCFTDEFEFELTAYEGKASSRLKTQYKEWLTSMKKEGGAFLKSVKVKVRDTSKRAYKDIRSRFQDIQHQKLTHTDMPNLYHHSQPRSAPSSPSFSHKSSQKVTTYVRERRGTAAVVEDIISSRQYEILQRESLMRNSSDGSLSDVDGPTFPSPIVDTDLMSDLHDVIFNYSGSLLKTSPGKTLPANKSLNDELVNQKKASTLNISSMNSKRISSLPPPAPRPPPRNKRRTASDGASQMSNQNSSQSPLIKLDSVEEDSVFPNENHKTINDTLIELQDAFNNISSQDSNKEKLQQTNPIYYAPCVPPRKSSDLGNNIAPKTNSSLKSNPFITSDKWLKDNKINATHFQKTENLSTSPTKSTSPIYTFHENARESNSHIYSKTSFPPKNLPLSRKASSPAALSTASSFSSPPPLQYSQLSKSSSVDGKQDLFDSLVNWKDNSFSENSKRLQMKSWETFQ